MRVHTESDRRVGVAEDPPDAGDRFAGAEGQRGEGARGEGYALPLTLTEYAGLHVVFNSMR